MVLVVVFFLVVVVLFQFFNPPGTGGDFFEVKDIGVQYLFEFHVAVVAGDDFCLGLQCVQNLADASEFLAADFAGLVEEYDVAELYLLDDEVGNVVLGKCLACKVQAAVELVLEPECIHDGADAVKGDVFAVGCSVCQLAIAAYRLGDGCRLADAACLDYDVVKAACLVYVLELLDEVHLQVAAYTAVLQCYERIVLLVDNTALLY